MLHILPPPPPALADQPPVYCQECGSWWQVDPDVAEPWRCDCGRPAIYAYQPGRCPRCDQSAQVMRRGHDLSRTSCECHLTREQLVQARAEAAYRAQRESRKRDEAAARRREEASLGLTRQAATECWNDPESHDGRAGQRHYCLEPSQALPYTFCRACPRFASRTDSERRGFK